MMVPDKACPQPILRQNGSNRSEREMLIYFTVLAIAIAAVAVVLLLLCSRQGA